MLGWEYIETERHEEEREMEHERSGRLHQDNITRWGVVMTMWSSPTELPSGVLVYAGLRYTQRTAQETRETQRQEGREWQRRDEILDASAKCGFT